MDDVKLDGKDDNELKRLLCTVKAFSDAIRMEFGLVNLLLSSKGN